MRFFFVFVYIEADSLFIKYAYKNMPQEYIEDGMPEKNYRDILSMLTRLRQACDHPLLVSSFPGTSSVEEVTKMCPCGSSKTNTALNILLNEVNQSPDGLAKGVGENYFENFKQLKKKPN